MARRSFTWNTCTSGTLTYMYKHKTRRVTAVLNEIESRKCFAIKTTIGLFHHIANNFTNRAPLTMNNFILTSVLTSNMRRSFCKLYTVSQEKNSQNCFYHNFVKFSLTLIIFGTLMAKTMKSCKVHSFSTSLNLCQCTTM